MATLNIEPNGLGDTPKQREVFVCAIAEGTALSRYLREIRSLPLLPHAREVELATIREQERTCAARMILSTPLAWMHLIHLGDRVRRGELAIEEVIEISGDAEPGAGPDDNGRIREERGKFLREIKALERITRRPPALGQSPEQNRLTRKLIRRLENLRLCRDEVLKIAKRLRKSAEEIAASRRSPNEVSERSIGDLELAIGLSTHELDHRLAVIATSEARAAQAIRDLAQANLRLVVTIARRYQRSGVPLGDLIQEGNLGLLRAAEKFDHRFGCRFSTYATWWIRQSISRSIINFGGTIRLPAQLVEQRQKIYRAARRLALSLGRLPLPAELARAVQLPLRAVEAIFRLPQAPLSLHRPIGPDEEKNLEHYVEDRRAQNPADAALQQLALDAACSHLGTLTARQQMILRHRFGIGMTRDHTLQEIGDMLLLTRERARQIEAQALRRLRAPATRDHPQRGAARKRPCALSAPRKAALRRPAGES